MQTTKLIFTIDYAKLNETYVFFQFIWQTNDESNPVWANSYHLDKLLTEQKALSTLYREGNMAFVMFLREHIQDVETFRQQLHRQADFFDIKVNPIQACQTSHSKEEISGAYLYQLLFNAIFNSQHEDMMFNNLNGQLVIFPPKKKDKKKDRKYDKDGYHIRIDNDHVLSVAVRNYIRKQGVMKDEKDLITRANKLAKPAYHFKLGRLVRDFTGKDMNAYVQAGRSNHHAQADALEVNSHDLFMQSRLGVLFATLTTFNRYYLGLAQVKFSEIAVSTDIQKRFHLLKNDKQFEKLAQTLNLKLIDKIDDDESRAILADIGQILEKLAVKFSIIRKESPKSQHLCLVKPKDYYATNKINDLYKQDDIVNSIRNRICHIGRIQYAPTNTVLFLF